MISVLLVVEILDVELGKLPSQRTVWSDVLAEAIKNTWVGGQEYGNHPVVIGDSAHLECSLLGLR